MTFFEIVNNFVVFDFGKLQSPKMVSTKDVSAMDVSHLTNLQYNKRNG